MSCPIMHLWMSVNIEPRTSGWIEQIHYIHIYWNKLIDNLDKETANKLFKRQCLLSNLNPDVLNFTAALSCTKSIWKLQLMMSVADSIAKQNIYAAPDFFSNS